MASQKNYKHHSKEIKEKALAMLMTKSQLEVSKKLKVPVATICRWKKTSDKEMEIDASRSEIEMENKKNEIASRKEQMDEFIKEAWKATINSIKLLNKRVEKATRDLDEIDETMQFIKDHKEELLKDSEMSNEKITFLFEKISKLQEIKISELSTIMGTAFDKYQVASGGATERIEVTSFEQYPE